MKESKTTKKSLTCKLKNFLNRINYLNFPFFLFSPKKILKGIKILFTKGPKVFIKKIEKAFILNYYQLSINQQYQTWLKKNYPTKKTLENQKKEIKKFQYRPLISIITPVYNPHPNHLKECLESVINQSYPNWQLCLVDDASTNKQIPSIIKQYAKKEKRIRYLFRKTNGHICQASNDALKLAKGEYIGLLDHDDFLWPNALYEVVKLLNEKPHAQFIYSDEDKLDYDGKTHLDPFFKPDWSPDYLRSINYITHFAVLKKSLVEKIGGFRLGTEGAQDWDLFLRASYWLEKNVGHCHPLDKKNPIQHIPTVLYSWRKTPQSTSSEKNAGKVKNYAYDNQVKVVKNFIAIKNKSLMKYLNFKPSQYLGQVLIELKDKKQVQKIEKTLIINLQKKALLEKKYLYFLFLIQDSFVLLPQKVIGEKVFNHRNEFLFFNKHPQSFPFVLKKDSFFNYYYCNQEAKSIINDIVSQKIDFICSKKHFNDLKQMKKLNIYSLNIIESPYFKTYE